MHKLLRALPRHLGVGKLPKLLGRRLLEPRTCYYPDLCIVFRRVAAFDSDDETLGIQVLNARLDSELNGPVRLHAASLDA
jgi:hypothetical protein